MASNEPEIGLRECPCLGTEAPEVLIHTDGGSRPNPGPGGWAAILWAPGWELELGGGAGDTTNNRMELAAALAGLNALTKPSRVLLVTDSEYLFSGMTDWITKWSRLGFRKKKGTLLNPDLWRRLAEAALEHDTSWAWTRGHSGAALNERCDVLAAEMIDAAHGDELVPTHSSRCPRAGAMPAVEGTKTAGIWLPA